MNLSSSLWEFGHAHPRLVAAAAFTGAVAGFGIGLPLAYGQFAPAVIALVTGVVVGLLARMVPVGERLTLACIAGAGGGLRLCAAAVLYYGSLASGRGGFITGDDASYAGLAWGYLQWLFGNPVAPYVPPYWHGDAYLFGSFAYLESALFWLFGPTPLAMTSLNALFSVIFMVLIYDIAHRLWDGRAAALTAGATALYPSLILWSALNLKDALTLLLVGAMFWVLSRMQTRPRWYLLAALALLLLPLESLRRYIYVGLAVLIPIGVVLANAQPARRRLIWFVASSAVSAVLLWVVLSTGGVGGGDAAIAMGGGFAGLERTREGMAVGARTAYADTPALNVRDGDTYVIVDPARTAPPPPPSGAPSQTAHVVVVAPGTRIVLANPSPTGPASTARPPISSASGNAAAARSPAASVVVVNPGDVVVVSTNAVTTPNPQATRQNLALRPETAADTVELVSTGGNTEQLALTRTLNYIPRGLAYALLAPFPWDLGRFQDAATIPEMLIWYLAVAALPFAVWRAPRWRELAPMLLYVAGLLGIFVLVEGNVGTLYRHRAMVIPFVFLLASPVLMSVATSTIKRVVRRSGRGPAARTV